MKAPRAESRLEKSSCQSEIGVLYICMVLVNAKTKLKYSRAGKSAVPVEGSIRFVRIPVKQEVHFFRSGRSYNIQVRP